MSLLGFIANIDASIITVLENMPEFEEDLYRSIITNTDASIPIALKDMSELGEDNPQDLYRLLAKETFLISVSPQSLIVDECISVSAPGEDSKLKSILNDTFCEELSFSHLFPTGKYCY